MKSPALDGIAEACLLAPMTGQGSTPRTLARKLRSRAGTSRAAARWTCTVPEDILAQGGDAPTVRHWLWIH
jgi:hypothetical protein